MDVVDEVVDDGVPRLVGILVSRFDSCLAWFNRFTCRYRFLRCCHLVSSQLVNYSVKFLNEVLIGFLLQPNLYFGEEGNKELCFVLVHGGKILARKNPTKSNR